MTFDISDEIRAAHLSYLQDEWDKWLLFGWKKENAMTWYSVKAFMKKFQINYEDLDCLKRVPRYKHHFFTRVSRFIAAYLPDLNTLLWSGRYTDEQIIFAMKSMDILMQPVDADKCNRERYERIKSMKTAMAESVSHQLVKGQRQYSAKSNWKHCK